MENTANRPSDDGLQRPERRRDVVVVGGGLSGLTAARHLAGRDVLLLESESRLGGRIRSEPRGTHWMNYGAHLYGGPQTPVGALIDELGVETLPVEGSFTALAYPGRLIARGGPARILASVPLSLRARIAFARSGLSILRHSRRYRRWVTGLQHLPAAEINRVLNGFMDDRTFADLLGPLPREVDQIYRAIANRAQGEPEQMSAGCALSAFALVFSDDRTLGRAVAGGSGRFVDALAADVVCDIELEATVTEVRTDAHGVAVTFRQGATTRTAHADHAIVATPPHVAADIVVDMPRETRRALRDIRYGPSLVLTMITNEQRAMPWDDVYAAVVPGKSFNMFFNQANPVRSRERVRGTGGSVMIYASGGLGRRLLAETDEAIRSLFLRDLYDVFPELVGHIEELDLHRWQYATSYAHPGRAALQTDLERDLGPITLAGDYLGAWFSDSAVLTGQAAAAKVAERLAMLVREGGGSLGSHA